MHKCILGKEAIFQLSQVLPHAYFKQRKFSKGIFYEEILIQGIYYFIKLGTVT